IKTVLSVWVRIGFGIEGWKLRWVLCHNHKKTCINRRVGSEQLLWSVEFGVFRSSWDRPRKRRPRREIRLQRRSRLLAGGHVPSAPVEMVAAYCVDGYRSCGQ